MLATLHTNDAIQAIDRVIDVFPPHQHEQIRQQLIPRADGRGRILATEVLLKNHAIAAHIRDGKTHQTRTILESSGAEGMITMDHRLKQMYEAELISYEQLARRVSSPTFLHQVSHPKDVQAEVEKIPRRNPKVRPRRESG